MIVKEFYRTRNDGVNLYRTYSDKALMIQKVGTNEIYDEAIDIQGAPYAYVEKPDMPIEKTEGEQWVWTEILAHYKKF